MAISYVGKSGARAAAPTGVQPGDYMLAICKGGEYASGENSYDIVPPSGWSLVVPKWNNEGPAQAGVDSRWMVVYGRVYQAGDPATYNFTVPGFSYSTPVVIHAYRGTAGVDAYAINRSYPSGVAQWTGPTIDAVAQDAVVTAFLGGHRDSSYANDGASVKRSDYTDPLYEEGNWHVLERPSGPGTTSPSILHRGIGSSYMSAVAIGLRPTNLAPTAPTLTTLASGEVIDRAVVNRASHTFADPDAGDSQSKFDHRWRLVGETTWTLDSRTTPNQWYDFPPDSLAVGDYERQVRTYDSLGVVGPWSASGFFSVGIRPPEPTITEPVNGSTVPLASYTVQWSAPDQDAYQVRKVADNAGAPDVATVYYDTGEVTTATARSRTLDFPVNNRTEHLQVRVKDDGLWSQWASVMVLVSYTQPAEPTVTLTPDADGGSLLVSIANPTPATDEPAASHNEVWVDDGDGKGFVRKADAVPVNGSWRYHLPPSGREWLGNLRVVTVGTNGTTRTTV